MSIILDHPNQPFYPGSNVAGSVLIDVKNPESCNRIFIQFLGRAHVEWTERRDGGGRPGTGVFIANYSWSKEYVKLEQTLWPLDQSPDCHLPLSEHSFRFCFNIPPAAPSSFDSTVGSIRYALHVKIVTGPLKFEEEIETIPIRVQEVVDVSDSYLLQPVCQEVQKTVCCLCCASAPIVLNVTVPKTGVYIGETLPIQVSIENGSSCRITLRASLHQNVVYTAQRHHRCSNKCLLGTESDAIAPNTTYEWSTALQMPATDVLDETSCSNIKISYFLKVMANILSISYLVTEIPLKLGYACAYDQAPLERNNFTPQPAQNSQLPPPYPHDRPPPYSQTASALYQAAPIGRAL